MKTSKPRDIKMRVLTQDCKKSKKERAAYLNQILAWEKPQENTLKLKSCHCLLNEYKAAEISSFKVPDFQVFVRGCYLGFLRHNWHQCELTFACSFKGGGGGGVYTGPQFFAMPIL